MKLPSTTLTVTPSVPIKKPAIKTMASSSMIAKLIATTPNAGSVSSPDKGGETAAVIMNINDANPINLLVNVVLNIQLALGLECFSSQRMRFIMAGITLP
jgi:hypothetical protein